MLLNDPQFVESYRVLAERAMKAEADPDAQIQLVFRLATRRRPIPDELALLRKYRIEQAARFETRPADVKQLLEIGSKPADPALPPAQVAAMTMMTAAVLNSPDAFSIR